MIIWVCKWSNFVNIPCVLEKNVNSATIECSSLCQLSWLTMSKSSISPLIVDLSIFPFSSISVASNILKSDYKKHMHLGLLCLPCDLILLWFWNIPIMTDNTPLPWRPFCLKLVEPHQLSSTCCLHGIFPHPSL